MKKLPALALALLLPACSSTYMPRDFAALDPASPLAFEDKGATGAGKDATKDGKPDTLRKHYGPAGAYAGGSVLYSFEQFDVSGPESATNSRMGLGLRAGWRIPEGYAAEVVFEDANDFRLRSGGPMDADIDIFSLGVQGKYFFTKDQTQPYFLAGFGMASARVEHFDDDSGGYFRLGGGVEHYFKEDMALFFEVKFDQLFGELNDLDHFDIQGGIIIHF